MSNPPTVLLSPRTPVRLPSGEIDIPSPPLPASKPTGSLLLQILPVLFAALGMGIILLVGSAQGGGMMAVLLVGTLLMVGGGAVVSVLVRRSQTSSFRAQTRERVELYYRMLIDTRDRVESLLVAQQGLLLEKDPDPAGCAQIVAERGPRLWERSPEDPDFLELRIGLGSLPSSVPVRPPRQPDPLRPDPLVAAAEELARWGNQLEGVPIRVPLIASATGPVGVCGPRSSVVECARAALVQLATQHAPDEVKLVALVPPPEAEEWSWLRWLPHCWSEDRRERFVATTPAEAARLSKRLEEVLSRRRDATTRFGLYASAADRKLPLPVFVFLVADEGLAESMQVLSRLSDANAAQTLGLSSLFLSSHRTRLPRSCRTILEVPQAALTLPDGEVRQLAIADGASIQLAAALAAGLAPLRVKRVASSAGLPNQVALLELLGVQTVEELEVLRPVE